MLAAYMVVMAVLAAAVATVATAETAAPTAAVVAAEEVPPPAAMVVLTEAAAAAAIQTLPMDWLAVRAVRMVVQAAVAGEMVLVVAVRAQMERPLRMIYCVC